MRIMFRQDRGALQTLRGAERTIVSMQSLTSKV
jgi:hypothetical protein